MITHELIKKRFRDRGLRFTSERYAIYKALAASTEHPSVEDLYAEVKPAYPTLSLNTVYNTLQALKDLGVASEISLWHNKARFDGNLKSHHHLVCIQCRIIIDLYDPSLERLSLSPKASHDFEVMGHRVEFQGTCRACRNRFQSKRPTRASAHAQMPKSKKLHRKEKRR